MSCHLKPTKSLPYRKYKKLKMPISMYKKLNTVFCCCYFTGYNLYTNSNNVPTEILSTGPCLNSIPMDAIIFIACGAYKFWDNRNISLGVGLLQLL